MTKSDQGNRWFGIDYHMNLYRGCNYGCIYCDSRSDAYHIGNFDVIKSKENALSILEEELASKKNKGVVSFGTLSDPYNEQEKKYKITRGALELIKKYGFGVSIDTKSDLILRDLDLLNDIKKNNNVIIKISICTTDNDLAKVLEPNVISPKRRLEVLKVLRENDIYAGLLMMPVLPFITDNEENIKKCVAAASNYGANFIYTKMGMTLRNKVREYYYEHIDKLYPGLSNDYKTVYEKSIVCNPLKYRDLLEVFINECNKYHILCDMTEIIKDYKKDIPSREQISFF
jgi:DNA repair photolyase